MLANRQDGTPFITNQSTHDALVVTVDQVKKQLNISHTDDDDLIELLIGSAQETFENLTGIYINRQSILYKCGEWAREEFCITSGGFSDLLPTNVEMSYFDTDNVATLYTDFTSYVSNNTLRVRHNSTPSIYNRGDAVIISYNCGWSTKPKSLLQTIILLAAHLYNNRDIVIIGTIVSEQLPYTLSSLINQYKVRVI